MRTDPSHARRTRLLQVLAGLSGLCALGYEVLFVRRLTTLFGDALWVHGALLCTFLVASAVGARLAHRAHRWLAVFEIGIGMWALALPSVAGAIGRHPSSFVLTTPLAAMVATATLVALPALLIGCSIPLFSAATVRGGRTGTSFRPVYALYNLGAAVGVLLVELVMLRRLGVAGSLYALGVVNVLIGVTLLVTGTHRLPGAATPPASLEPRLRWALLTVAAASGAFQLYYLKSLFLTLGPSREHFALSLAIGLAGIAIGTVLVIRGTLDFQRAALAAPTAMALSWLALPLLQGTDLLPGGTGSPPGVGAQTAAAIVLGLPAFVCFGATVPALLARASDVAAESGSLLLFAGLGNAVGYVLFTTILHPLLDGGALLIVLGASSLGAAGMAGSLRRRPGLIAMAAATLALLAVAWNEPRFQLGGWTVRPGERAEVRRWWSESVTLVRSGPDEWLSYNGHPSIHIRSDGVVNRAELTSGIIPALRAPGRTRAAVLGLGSGLTAGAAARMFEELDVIEINGAFLDLAATLATANLDVVERDGVSIHIGDARAFLAGHRNRYDAVINSVPAPTFYAASKIYTREFYETAAEALVPGGVFATWLAPHEMTTAGMRTVLSTLQTTFAQCDLWLLNPGYYMTTCTREPAGAESGRVDPDAGVEDPDLRWLLEQGLPTVDGFPALLRLSSGLVPLPFTATEPNTDDQPRLEFEVSRETTGIDPILADPAGFRVRPWPRDTVADMNLRRAILGAVDPAWLDALVPSQSPSDPGSGGTAP